MRYVPRLAAVMVLALSALAAAAQIKDDAGFFSRDAVAKADAKLVELKDKYRHSVAIETYAELPIELRGKVDGNDASAERAYNTFSAMRANALAADVYVLIVRNPSKLNVAAADDVARSGLTSTGRAGLRQELLNGFRAKQYDDALTGMTASLERTYANLGTRGSSAPPVATPPGTYDHGSNSARTPTTPTPAQPARKSGGLFANMGCIGLVVIAVVVMLVIGLIRRMFGGNRNAGYGGQAPPPGYGQGNYGAGGYGGGYPPQTGGGFGRGIAGGLLGGLFGSWLGGNVFGQGHHTSGDTNSSQDTGSGYSGGNDAGNSGGDATGFSSSGGDFGNSGGGSSDAGSGFSSSGGDFGGGDSGGGGGDSGGGGGDF